MDKPTRTALRRLSRRSLAGVATAVLGLSTGLMIGIASPALADGHRHHHATHRAQEVALPDGLRPEGITSGSGLPLLRRLAGRRPHRHRRPAHRLVVDPAARRHRTPAARPLLGQSQQPRLGGRQRRRRGPHLGRRRPTRHRPPGHRRPRREVPQRPRRHQGRRLGHRLPRRPADRALPRSPRRAHRGCPQFLPLTGAWPAGDGVANNANGIRQLKDGSAILNNSRVGGLWRVDPGTGSVTEIPVQRRPRHHRRRRPRARRTHPLQRARQRPGRGLRPDARAHRHGQWTATWRGALTSPRLDVPSTATLVGRTLWAVNARFGVASPETAPYWITPLPTRR